ncbi:carbonic anhydrase [Flavitalea flava]
MYYSRRTDDIIRGLLAKSLATASVDEKGWKNVTEEGGSAEAQHISFLTISNQAASILEDVQRIKNHPLVPAYIPVYGYIYDVKTGKLIEIPEATKAGRAR